jgi:hypothetical protein
MAITLLKFTENFQQSTELIKFSSIKCNQTKGRESQDKIWELFNSISQLLSLHFITKEYIKGEAASLIPVR